MHGEDTRLMSLDREIRRRLQEQQRAAEEAKKRQAAARQEATARKQQEELRAKQDIARRHQEALAELHRLGLVDKMTEFQASVWGGKGTIETGVHGDSYPVAFVSLKYTCPHLYWTGGPGWVMGLSGGTRTLGSPRRSHVGEQRLSFSISIGWENGTVDLWLGGSIRYANGGPYTYNTGRAGRFPYSDLDERLVEAGVAIIEGSRTPQAMVRHVSWLTWLRYWAGNH
jgi:hypothetical protein